jgi:hypothetical protein
MSFRKIISIFLLLAAIVGFVLIINSSSLETLSPVSEPKSDFALVVLPDTQFYARDYPEIFESQTQWIVNQKDARHVVFVSHVGDITQSWNVVREWRLADKAMSVLDGEVPYGVLPGNHDDPKMFNLYFPFTRFEDQVWYGGHYGLDNNNSYQLFSAAGMDFVILHLEYQPSEAVLEWADEILEKHSQRRAIVTTHYLLDYDGFRSPEGEQIYQTLVDNPNLFLFLCGHIHFEVKRTDNVNGRPVHQLLADYQTRLNGGDGWLRILKFIPEENKIYVETYSPWLDEYETDANSQFELDYEMTGDVLE